MEPVKVSRARTIVFWLSVNASLACVSISEVLGGYLLLDIDRDVGDLFYLMFGIPLQLLVANSIVGFFHLYQMSRKGKIALAVLTISSINMWWLFERAS